LPISAKQYVWPSLPFCAACLSADSDVLSALLQVAEGLSGVGHSTAYAEDAPYNLACRYLFETTQTRAELPKLEVEEFLASEAKNSYEIPWILVRSLFFPDLFNSERPKVGPMKLILRSVLSSLLCVNSEAS
jgi:hypothetical protein